MSACSRQVAVPQFMATLVQHISVPVCRAVTIDSFARATLTRTLSRPGAHPERVRGLLVMNRVMTRTFSSTSRVRPWPKPPLGSEV